MITVIVLQPRWLSGDQWWVVDTVGICCTGADAHTQASVGLHHADHPPWCGVLLSYLLITTTHLSKIFLQISATPVYLLSMFWLNGWIHIRQFLPK